MMNLKNKLSAILIIALVISVSCKKDKEEEDTTTNNTGGNNKDVCLVTKATSENNVDTANNFTREYIYDASDRVVEFKDDDGENWKMSYDGNNKLTKVDFIIDNESGAYDEYVYNSNGQVDMVKSFQKTNFNRKVKGVSLHLVAKGLNAIRNANKLKSSSGAIRSSAYELKEWSKYEYNEKGWITKETIYNAEDTTISGEGRYTYDNNGNAVKVEFYADMTNTGNLELVGSMSAKYGEEKSPVSSIKYLPPAFLGPLGSKNYLIETTMTIFGQEIKVTYSNETNSSKYVVKSTKNDGSVEKFEYRCN